MSALLMFGLGVFVTPACGAPDSPAATVKPPDQAAAIAAAEAWLRSIDSEDYAGSWDRAATYFRHAITKDQWVASLNGARRPLGALTSRRLLSAEPATRLPGAPDGHYVVIQFQTAFANKKLAVETATSMLDTDGAWRVAGYLIK